MEHIKMFMRKFSKTRVREKMQITPVLPQLPEVLCQDLSNLWADMRNGVFNRSFRHRMRGYERLWNIPRYSPQWSQSTEKSLKKPYFMRVFEKLQISKNANLRQIYAKRYQLTPIYAIVRKSPRVNLGKIGAMCVVLLSAEHLTITGSFPIPPAEVMRILLPS